MFLPSEEVGNTFVELIGEQPNDDRLVEFSDYLVDYYIDDDSSFPPHTWAAPECQPWRTTNGCEAFHSKFSSACPSPHPNINVFVKCISDFQIDTYIKINSVKGSITKKADTFISNKIKQYVDGEIDMLSFVKCVSYKYNKNFL